MNAICFIIGLFVGSNVGLFVYALLAAAARESRKQEFEINERMKGV